MDVRELRIGNIVSTRNPKQKTFRIDEIYRNGVDDYGVGSFQHIDVEQFMKDQHPLMTGIGMHPLTWDCSELIPIPLTPEVLEKVGFQKENDHSHWYLGSQGYDFYARNGFEIAHKDGKYAMVFSSEDDFYSTIGRQLESVHQLQNLFYANNGEELPINL